MAIDLQNNKNSHMLSFLSLAPLRYGYDNGKFSFLLNKRIKDDAAYLDPLEHQFRILKLAGIKPVDKRLELWPSASDEEKAARVFGENWIKDSQKIVGINVRASARWASKNWPPRYIAQLCDRLARDLNVRAVLTGTRADEALAKEIARSASSRPVIAAGRTSVLELAGLIKRCGVYVTADSAPLHIASAVGTPAVALFGPTDPSRHAVPSDTSVVISKKVKCGPCYSPACMRKAKCMREISVDEVFAAVKDLMSPPASKGVP
jgi:ADP-heptose:LPS heptosyltransferase